MSANGGIKYGRRMEREARRRQFRLVTYVGLAMLAVMTAAVVVLAFQN